ncbi:MAG: NAD(P)-dependent oxidoreductase [Alicyclobacillus sp.]|nr:NAD(P)-dependent oxidoreductase [Alicyclobacillus sp.]
MGSGMVRNLLRKGYRVTVYNRTRSKAAAVLAEGARWADSPGALAAACDAVLTIVGYPQDVEQVYLGPDGLVERARPGTYLVDLTTSTPSLAQRIAAAAQARGLYALDAPVSGGDTGARNGTLSIMVGGDEEAFQAVLPVLQAMGQNIVRQGGPGAGQHTKMCNQIAIAANMVGVCEALAYAQRAGLDAQRVLQSIATGAAGSWSLSNLAPRMLKGDFAPGFYVKHMIKDLGIALAEAERLRLDLPGVALAKRLYEQLAGQGGADDGTQALYKLYAAAGPA